ncbi:MAG TPA: hypothetical protein VN688_28755 [Gemmataceae bacterium]|nr:hypothetical protein [Gemmataceae bacterium]
MYPHRIRLRAPWGCERLPAGLPNADSGQRTADCGLPTADCGRRFRRRFGYPGRIDAYERVWLTFVGVAGAVEVWLNDVALGRRNEASGAFEFEVTPLLRPRNELVVDVEGTAEQGVWDEVALEVRCTAFLRGLSWFAIKKGERAELHVTGQVVGVAERPLELYIVLDRSVVAYQVVTATTEGQPFEIVVPDLAVEDGGSVVKVDLVNGASVWYTNEGTVTLESRSSLGG